MLSDQTLIPQLPVVKKNRILLNFLRTDNWLYCVASMQPALDYNLFCDPSPCTMVLNVAKMDKNISKLLIPISVVISLRTGKISCGVNHSTFYIYLLFNM